MTVLPAESLQALGRVADRWLEDTVLRQQAVQALRLCTPFSEELILRAIDNAFSELTEPRLRTFSEAFKVQDVRRGRTLHILPSNVFTAWLPTAVIPLMMGYDCDLKPSVHEPVFAPLWRRSLDEEDPRLGQRVRVLPGSPTEFSKYEAVIAYGSDETLSTVQLRVRSHVRFVGYGHKMSAAVILKEAMELPETVENLMKDASLFQLQGCLSPQRVYVEGNSKLLRNCIRELALMPYIRTISRLEEVVEDLRPFSGALSCIGVAGSLRRLRSYQADLESLGMTRLCPLGEMQKPPLSWCNGGISLPEILDKIPLRARSSIG